MIEEIKAGVMNERQEPDRKHAKPREVSEADA